MIELFSNLRNLRVSSII